jgi:RimJ/RimL family protein N-acetyltransferase
MLGNDLLRGEQVYLSAWHNDDIPIVLPGIRTRSSCACWTRCPRSHALPASQNNGWKRPHGVAWLGIGIGEPDNRGSGFGHEAISLMLRFAFWEINLYRVQLTVFAYNTPAITTYERLGFVREGIFREFLQRDGQRHDMVLYGLLRREWEALQNTSSRT